MRTLVDLDNTLNIGIDDVLKKYGAREVSAMHVYTDMFHLGEGMIQRNADEEKNMKSNPILLFEERTSKQKLRRFIMFEEHFEKRLNYAQMKPFSILNGITYFGRRKTNNNANKMYAMIFDIDLVEEKEMANFLSGCEFGIYPTPNYISLTGGGMHLYYVFDKPISLYPHAKTLLKDLKFKLTDKMWNMYTSKDDKPQHQGISQGFRVIGGCTKKGHRVRAFQVREEKTTLQYLHDFLGIEDKDKIKIEDINYVYKTKYTLEEAKEKFPEWYEKVVVNNDRSTKKWSVKRDLYDWWKRKIREGASVGHRYFCIMCLAIYATKCDVSYDELKKDAYELIPFLNAMSADDPFTENDVESALESYDLRYKTFPRKDISKITAIEIKVNKRNKRSQKDHLLRARTVQELDYPNGEWRNKNGRPVGSGTKRDEVIAFLKENEDMNITEIARALNVSRPTIYKYKKELKNT